MNRNSLVIRFDGQAGDGVLSIGHVLAKAAASAGYHVLTQSLFSSEVRGGSSTFQVRLGRSHILSPGENPDIVVALDTDGARKHARVLAADGLLLHAPGITGAELDLNPGQESHCFDWKSIATTAGAGARSQNMVAAGVAAALVGLDCSALESTVAKRFARDPEAAEANVRAARAGFESIANLNGSSTSHRLGASENAPMMLMSGNEALAFGAMAGNIRFYAGYPITPASEIMEVMAKHLPGLGGKFIQAEDEIASLAMCLGASFGGAPSMTATSGPGLALMCELISLSSMAEIPVVIADVQRAGPSTGMPTKDGQADLSISVHGTHGDAPRVVLAAQTVADCFYQAVRAVNIAQKYHVPVILLSSQAISHSQETVELPDLERLPTHHETLYSSGAEPSEFRRYGESHDGHATTRSIPGTPNGMYRTTGLEHNEFGNPSVDPTNRVKMMARRAERMQLIAQEQGPLEQPELPEDGRFPLALVGWGRAASAAREAWYALHIDGIKLATFFPHLLWPLPEAGFKQLFASGVRTLFVCETNSSGQFAQLIRSQLSAQLVAHGVEVVEITKDDGNPLTQHEIRERVLEHLEHAGKRATHSHSGEYQGFEPVERLRAQC
jgi:2-oxoglutarate ferredoxin oxidoreductase subunit alpha